MTHSNRYQLNDDRSRLWPLATGCLLAVMLSSGCMRVVSVSPTHVNRSSKDSIYSHDVAQQGKDIGLTAPPGFSYEIQYDAFDAAAIGESEDYKEVDEMSKTDIAALQEKYADEILVGLNKCVARTTPDWVDGKDAALIRPNYYPGDDADPITFTLKKEAFPYDASKPAGKELRDGLLKAIRDHWGNITN